MSYSVTLEIPDALYQKFKVRSQKANRSVEDEFLTAFAVDLPVLPSTETAVVQAYEEILDFLAGGPSRLDPRIAWSDKTTGTSKDFGPAAPFWRLVRSRHLKK